MAEQKTIVLNKGIRHAPTGSDVGELTECVNLVVKKGEIVNAPTLTQVPDITIPNGYTLVYIHKTSEGDNYILTDENGILCYMRDGENNIVSAGVPQSVKNELYQQYVSLADAHVKACREQIMVKQKELASASIDQQTLNEDQAKLDECFDGVSGEFTGIDDIIGRYLVEYDLIHNTHEKDAWDNLTSLQKYNKLYKNDYGDTIFVGLNNRPKSHTDWWQYGDVNGFRYWYALETSETDCYIFTSIAYNAVANVEAQNTGCRDYANGDKAYLYVRIKHITKKSAEPNVETGEYEDVPYTYGEVIAGSFDENGNDNRDWMSNNEDNHAILISTLLSKYGISIDDNTYQTVNFTNGINNDIQIGELIFGGTHDAYVAVRNDFLKIDELVDRYYNYYYPVYNYDRSAEIEAELASLQTDLANYLATLETAENNYNNALNNEIVDVAKLCDSQYRQVTSIGNMLCISTSNDISQCIFKDGQYIRQDIPELDLQFRLRSDFATAVSDRDITIDVLSNTEDYVRTENSILVAYAKNDDDPVYGSVIGHGLFGADRHSYACDYELLSPLEANKWFKIVLSTGNTKASDKWHIYLYDGNTEVLGDTQISKTDSFWTLERIIDKRVTRLRIVYADRFSGHVSQDTHKAITLNCDIYKSDNTSRYGIKRTSDNFTTIEGNINKFIKTQSVDKDKFMFPFFVRYAYKTYDGRYIYPSAPVLMQPNTGRVPFIIASGINDANSSPVESTIFDCNAFVSSLEYRIMSDENSVRSLLSYKDIIKEVVIAVSAPIYTYDTDVVYDENKLMPYGIEHVDYGESKNVDYSISVIDGGDYSRKVSMWGRIAELIDRNGAKHNDYICIKLPTLTKAKIEESVKSSSNFYVIKSISIDDIVSNYNYLTFLPVDMENGTLGGLLGRERITDNAISLHKYIPDAMIAYNNRLLLGGLKESKYMGYNAGVMVSNLYADSVWTRLNITDEHNKATTLYQDENVNYSMNVHYGTIVECSVDNTTYKQYRPINTDEVNVGINGIRWFYYPLSSAKKVTIYRYRRGVTINHRNQSEDVNDLMRVTLELKEHPNLDGAYWFNNFKEARFDETIDIMTDASGNIVDSQSYDSDTRKILGFEPVEESFVEHSNKIIQTEVNNPLTLDINSAEYIGNGKIMAIAPNTTALSQGQFGQHPVMCFTSEGMYALAIDGEGKITNKQPYSRDIIKGNTTPLLTDSSIIFATDSGLKMMSSRGIEDISSQMFGARENFPLGGILTEYDSIIPDDNVSFVSVLDGCKMMYDSANKLIHVYSSRLSGVHYVMSLVSGEWSQMEGGTPNSVVVGYPYSIMQIAGSLYEYKETNDTTTTRKGLLLTREISFDNPFAMKMLHWIRLIRKSTASDCKIAVFVSNDRDNWMRLRSLKSHSYKWYRIAVFTQMTDVDAIEGIVCGVEARRVNKIR